MLAGFVGCILPIVPGPPLSYIGLLVLQLKEDPPFGILFMVIWAAVTIAVAVLDYFVPIYGTKKLGGSKKGIIGSALGLLVGLFFFPPFGIIIGPLLGALLGEMVEGKKHRDAMRSALGSFLGFLAGTVIKLIASGMMAYYFISSL